MMPVAMILFFMFSFFSGYTNNEDPHTVGGELSASLHFLLYKAKYTTFFSTCRVELIFFNALFAEFEW